MDWTGPPEDVAAIDALIAAQFASLSWAPGRDPDWAGFAAGFLPDAPLYPSARPARPTSVAAFVERMGGVRARGLERFDEAVAARSILVFGTVAVAAVECRVHENGAPAPGTVEMLLLVKDGDWRIAAQAWDKRPAA